MSLAPDDPRHGTHNAYNNLKCRCDACRAAWAAYYRKGRHIQGAQRRATSLPRNLPPDLLALFRQQRADLAIRHADEMDALIDWQLAQAQNVKEALS